MWLKTRPNGEWEYFRVRIRIREIILRRWRFYRCRVSFRTVIRMSLYRVFRDAVTWAGLALLAVFCPAASAQQGWVPFPQEVTRANLWSAAYGAGTLVVAGEEGTILSYRYAEDVWSRGESGTAVWLVGAGYGAGRFIVVGDRGTILTSDDNGETWMSRASGTTARLNAAAYGGGRWLVVGEQGVVLTSSDGTTWSSRPALGNGFLRALAYGRGQFLIGGADGALFTTTDAMTFTPVAIATTANIEAAAISANRFWIVGSDGLWASATEPGAWAFGPPIASSTFRGLAARNADEAIAVAEVGAAVFRNGTWAVDSPAPPFLATAAVQAENEMIAVGFAGGVARAVLGVDLVVTNGRVPVEYGSNVRLIATAVSNQPTTYQWTTPDDLPIPGATGLELEIPRITPERADYRLHFVTPGGSGYQGVTVPLYPVGQPEVRDPNFVSALPRAPALVVPQPDGKILVAGSFSVTPAGGATYGLARLNADGSLDMSFRAGEGIASTATISAMEVLPDGRIYVRGSFMAIAGQPRPGLARLLANGALDAGFQPALAEPPVQFAAAPDGKLYVQAGYTYFDQQASLRRLAPDGSADAAFSPVARHELVGVDPQGRLLTVDFTSATAPRLVRLLADGTRDSAYLATPITSFRGITQSGNDLSVVQITPTGLYAASARWSRVGTSYSFLKYKPDGGIDPDYRPPPAAQFLGSSSFLSFAYRPDGGLWQVVSHRGGYQARSYAPSGAPDPSRYATPPNRSDFYIMAVAPDGSLLAIGNRYQPPQTSTFIRVRPLAGRPGRITNLSVRAFVPDAGSPLIAGFVTAGEGTAGAIVRGVGPGLGPLGVGDAMADPRLTLFRGALVAGENDSWDAALAARFAGAGAFALPPGSADAALEAEIGAGNHSVVVVPAAGSGGTSLAEVFQTGDPFATPRRFVNVSSRGPVAIGRPLIAGFTITGDVPVQVLIRASGPAIGAAPFSVPGALADPRLTLYRGAVALWDNNDWSVPRITHATEIAAAAAAAGAFPVATGSQDSAMLIALAPGSYTAVVTNGDENGGTALVEVYQVP